MHHILERYHQPIPSSIPDFLNLFDSKEKYVLTYAAHATQDREAMQELLGGEEHLKLVLDWRGGWGEPSLTEREKDQYAEHYVKKGLEFFIFDIAIHGFEERLEKIWDSMGSAEDFYQTLEYAQWSVWSELAWNFFLPVCKPIAKAPATAMLHNLDRDIRQFYHLRYCAAPEEAKAHATIPILDLRTRFEMFAALLFAREAVPCDEDPDEEIVYDVLRGDLEDEGEYFWELVEGHEYLVRKDLKVGLARLACTALEEGRLSALQMRFGVGFNTQLPPDMKQLDQEIQRLDLLGRIVCWTDFSKDVHTNVEDFFQREGSLEEEKEDPDYDPAALLPGARYRERMRPLYTKALLTYFAEYFDSYHPFVVREYLVKELH